MPMGNFFNIVAIILLWKARWRAKVRTPPKYTTLHQPVSPKMQRQRDRLPLRFMLVYVRWCLRFRRPRIDPAEALWYEQVSNRAR